MKLSNLVATSAALATSANAVSFNFDNLQQVFVAPSINNAQDKTPFIPSKFMKTAYDLISNVADSVGESWKDIPKEAIGAWAEAIQAFPNAVAELKVGTQKQLKKAGSIKKANDITNWLFKVQSDDLPNHTLRIKSPESLGIDDVKQYSGYLDVGNEKHLFFWSFESRNDPQNDPVILWLNGGPGCSSLTGLFFELGPASIGKDLKPIKNPYSWNNNATVIFLDQPADTGFSYTDGETVSDTVTAGKDTYAFLKLFFKQFPEYTGQEFHIAGESYAGHYIPVFASEILSHKDRSFNLTSVAIGNGLTDPLRQYDFYEPMACGKGGADSVLSEDECQGMINSQSRCNSLINSCYNTESTWTCLPAAIYCNNAMMGPYQRTGKNVYDIRSECGESSLCYDDLENVDKYLNQDFVKKALGADIEEYSGCNFDVNRNFLTHGDWMKPYYKAVVDILEKDLPVLIYAGDKDFICNWLGNENWVRNLEWSGQKGIADAKVHPWIVDGEKAGTKFNYEKFTFLRVFEAGHMVPYNQPENSLSMINSWVAGDYAFSK
jgi:cathepsin A (carboxypeptidase C)